MVYKERKLKIKSSTLWLQHLDCDTGCGKNGAWLGICLDQVIGGLRHFNNGGGMAVVIPLLWNNTN